MATRSTPSFWVFFGLLLVAHFLLHIGLGIGNGAPDLLTAALLLGVRRVRGSVAAAMGLGLGLLNDSFSTSSFGADAVVLTIIGYLGARSRDLFEGESMFFMAGYLFLGKLLHDLGYWMLARDTARPEFLTQLFLTWPLNALYCAGAGLLALLIFRATTGEK